MAYLDTDPNKQGGNGQNSQPQTPGLPQAPGGGGDSGLIGSGGFSAPGAQAGTGGNPTSANMQDYVSANQGQSKTADNLNSKIGSQFDQEKTSLQSQAADTKSQADAEVSKYNLSPDEAAKAVTDMQNQYSQKYAQSAQATNQFGAVNTKPTTDGDAPAPAYQPTQDYDSAKGTLSNVLNAKYAGPSQFQYNYGDQTNQYGAGLQNEGAFKNTLNALYGDSNNGQALNTGQLALQNQLDTNDPNVASARTSLLGKYNDLNSLRDSSTADVTGAIANDQSQVANNAQTLKDSLTSQAGASRDLLTQAANQANRSELEQKKKDALSKYKQENLGMFDDPTQVAQWAANPAGKQAMVNYINGITSYDDIPGATPITQQNPFTANSVSGLDDQRYRFDSIMDALGNNDRLDYTPRTG